MVKALKKQIRGARCAVRALPMDVEAWWRSAGAVKSGILWDLNIHNVPGAGM